MHAFSIPTFKCSVLAESPRQADETGAESDSCRRLRIGAVTETRDQNRSPAKHAGSVARRRSAAARQAKALRREARASGPHRGPRRLRPPVRGFRARPRSGCPTARFSPEQVERRQSGRPSLANTPRRRRSAGGGSRRAYARPSDFRSSLPEQRFELRKLERSPSLPLTAFTARASTRSAISSGAPTSASRSIMTIACLAHGAMRREKFAARHRSSAARARLSRPADRASASDVSPSFASAPWLAAHPRPLEAFIAIARIFRPAETCFGERCRKPRLRHVEQRP